MVLELGEFSCLPFRSLGGLHGLAVAAGVDGGGEGGYGCKSRGAGT